jgi:hypothetical protein
MEIINVVETKNGVVLNIDSFVIQNDKELSEVVKNAESLFMQKAMKKDADLTVGEADELIGEGFDDGNGYTVDIIWSHTAQ